MDKLMIYADEEYGETLKDFLIQHSGEIITAFTEDNESILFVASRRSVSEEKMQSLWDEYWENEEDEED